MNKILDKYLAERKQPQDKDVDDVKGSQPKKYFKGLDKDDKKARANYFARGGGRGKAPGDDDPDAKTTPSKHTKKYKQLFGDNVDEGVLQGRDYVFDKKKKKVVISKDNYKKVQRDSKTTIKGVPYIMYNMGNQGTVLAPVHFEEVELGEEEEYDTLYDTFVEAEELEMSLPMRNFLQKTRKQLFDMAKKSGLKPKKVGSGSGEKLEIKGTPDKIRKMIGMIPVKSMKESVFGDNIDEKIVATGDAISKIFKTKNKKEIDGIANLMSMTNVKVLQSMQKQNPKGFSRMAAKMGELPAMEEIEEKKKDMTAISSWKKKLKKVKGLSKDQMYMLTQLPTPVITSLINQIGMVVASNDMAEDGHTDVISAKNQVKIAMKALNTMNQELNKLNDEDELPSWWTNKVAVAVNKLDGMADYLDIKVENVRDIFNESDIKGLQEKAEKALKNKAKETGMPLGILRKVFQRGVKAWQSGHRPGTNAVQWGLARVNSFVTKGKGTWGKADSDLAAKVRKSEEIEEKAPDTDDAMKRYKAGKAGFTDKAHLKAKGLIPRADGTKRKSDKYK